MTGPTHKSEEREDHHVNGTGEPKKEKGPKERERGEWEKEHFP